MSIIRSSVNTESLLVQKELEVRERLYSEVEENKDSGKMNPNKEKKKLSKGNFLWILLSMNFMWTGIMAFFDFPQLFEAILIKNRNLTTFQVEFLYSATCGPSLVITTLSALVLKKIGLGAGAVISAGLAFFGILICYWGIECDISQSFIWLVIGRIIYGIGEEVNNAVQISIAELWFSGSFLTISCSLNRLVVFTGMSAAAYFQPSIYLKKRNLEIILFGYAVFCFISFISNFSYLIAERKNWHIVDTKKQKKSKSGNDGLDRIEEDELEYLNYEPTLGDLIRSSWLSKLTILVTGTHVAIYYTFTNFVTDMLVNRFSFTFEEAKNKVAILPVFGLIFTPLFSVIVAKIGKKGIVMTISGILVFSSFLIMYFMSTTPGILIYIPFSLLGLYYGLYNSVVWGAMAFASSKQMTSMNVAFGIGFMSLNLTILPMVFGVITKDRNQAAYTNALFWLVIFAGFCLLLAILTMIVDLRGSKVLHIPENDERVAKIRDWWSRELYQKSLERKRKGGKVDDYKSMRSKGEGGIGYDKEEGGEIN